MSNVIMSNLNSPTSEEIFCPCSENSKPCFSECCCCRGNGQRSSCRAPSPGTGRDCGGQPEPFLVNHTPQQLHNQSLKAHLLFEFLWGSTEDEIWFSINRSLVPLMFPLGSEERSDDGAGILLFPLRNST